jgi:hypothetical protein
MSPPEWRGHRFLQGPCREDPRRLARSACKFAEAA